MDDLRALFTENPSTALMASGLLIGFVFGAILFRTNFCTMGAVSDWVNFGDTRRLRSWLLAIAVAMVGTQALGHLEVVDPNDSIFVSESFIWFGNLTGGALFGFGMVFAGGCASRNLTRLGGGDIRALFALIIMGIVAYSSMSGVLSGLRRALQQLGAVDMPALGVSTTNVGTAVGHIFG
ncbi:MAG: YeeE/YedE thiosulfate transporter family protein, partial [Pseudomonadota bacterium]